MYVFSSYLMKPGDELITPTSAGSYKGEAEMAAANYEEGENDPKAMFIEYYKEIKPYLDQIKKEYLNPYKK